MRDTIKLYVRNILSVSEDKVLIITYSYLLITVFSPSHKFVFLISSVYFLLMVFFTGSIVKTIFYSFYPMWLFRVGRDFVFPVIPSGVIESHLYWGEGRNLTFELSPFFILGISASLILPLNFMVRKLRTPLHNIAVLFLIIYLLHFLSAFFSSVGVLPFVYTAYEFSFLVWFILGLGMIQKADNFGKNKIFTTLFLILSGMLVMEGCVTVLQVMNRSTLGLSIEKVIATPSFGMGAEESTLLYRPVGLNYHANALANWQIELLVTLYLLWFQIKGILRKDVSRFLIISVSLTSLVIILLTLSRSAYLSVFLIFSLIFLFDRTSLFRALKSAYNYLSNFKLPILFALIFFSIILSKRIFGSFYSFAETGGISTRLIQLTDALELIQYTPFLGVGIGMYIPLLFEFNPGGSIRLFPEAIHNGFVLYLVERGFLALFIYLFTIKLIIKMLFSSRLSKTFKLLAVGGIAANYVMMLFQPFINFLSLNVMVTAALIAVYNGKKR